MSESEHIAAAPPQDSAPNRSMDEEDRLRPEFVDKVLDAVEAGDDETARELVEPLHPADVADLIELAARDEREGLVKALAGIVDADVLAEMNDYVREDLLDEMEPQQVADIAGQLETDDAVALIEDLDARRAAGGAPSDGARRPRRGRGSAQLSGGIRRPPDAARPVRGARALEGRPGHRLSALDARTCRPISGKCSSSTRPTTRSAPASCRRSCARRATTLGQRHHAARADPDPGRHGPGRCRAALPEICAGLGRGGRRRRAGWSA